MATSPHLTKEADQELNQKLQNQRLDNDGDWGMICQGRGISPPQVLESIVLHHKGYRRTRFAGIFRKAGKVEARRDGPAAERRSPWFLVVQRQAVRRRWLKIGFEYLTKPDQDFPRQSATTVLDECGVPTNQGSPVTSQPYIPCTQYLTKLIE